MNVPDNIFTQGPFVLTYYIKSHLLLGTYTYIIVNIWNLAVSDLTNQNSFIRDLSLIIASTSIKF